jgi:hypothetical protein
MNTTTKGTTTTTAAAGERDGPSPFEPTSSSATDAGPEAAATTKDSD